MAWRRTVRRRDRRQARFLTWVSLRWMVRHRAFTPWYLVRYWRLAKLRLTQPDVVTEGMVFLGKRVDLRAKRGYGRVVLGRWVHIGDGCAIRAHEGTLRIGDKCVFGTNATVNAYLDIEFGSATLVADWVYVCDFDHVTTDLAVPIKDQGIVKAPVRIGPDCWLGTKATITRGVRVGRGSVVAANAVVTRDVPDHAVVGGVPARLIRSRRPPSVAVEEPAAAASPGPAGDDTHHSPPPNGYSPVTSGRDRAHDTNGSGHDGANGRADLGR